MSRRARKDNSVTELNGAPQPPGRDPSSAAVVTGHMALLARMLRDFEDWLTEWGEDAARWAAFDHLIRNELNHIVGAERVRCFRVVCGGEALESLVPAKGKLHALVPAGEGILGYVLSHGHPYHRLDPTVGPTVHQLAEAFSDPLCWCFPILERNDRLGVVSVGRMGEEAASDPHLLETLARVVSLMWRRLSENEKLAVARQTDEGTGVLTRGNFFRVAEAALMDGYADWEPAVVLVVVVEGVRRLDDTGLWKQRDDLLTTVGNAIRAKLRSDDVVGRFADDRFVVLLRRLDTSLGQMITRKLLEKTRAAVADCAKEGALLRVRCGLAGTRGQRPTLRELVSAGFAAAERARLEDRDLVFASELEPAAPVADTKGVANES